MNIELVRASLEDAEVIWKMQRIAFAELLERYQDFDTNPGNEPLEKVQWRFSFPATYFYFIQVDGVNAGAIRIIDHHDDSPKKISPLFVLPQFRGRGIGTDVVRFCQQQSPSLMLYVFRKNTRAIALYRKLGFIVTKDVSPTRAIMEWKNQDR